MGEAKRRAKQAIDLRKNNEMAAMLAIVGEWQGQRLMNLIQNEVRGYTRFIRFWLKGNLT